MIKFMSEHVYIFSAISCENIFGRHGFELINLLPQSTHGDLFYGLFLEKKTHVLNKDC